MIYLIAELVLGTTVWAVKSTYNAGYYMLYGSYETTDERILKQIEEMRGELRREQEQEREELQRLKINLYQRLSDK
jgi:hypothetical protein